MLHKNEPSPINNIDPVLLSFLKEKVNSLVKWDLVRFFHDNPHAIDTAQNVARYTGRELASVEGELHALTTAGVPNRRTASGVSVYMLSENDEVRRLVDQFMSACDDRRFRMQAMYRVIYGLDTDE